MINSQNKMLMPIAAVFAATAAVARAGYAQDSLDAYGMKQDGPCWVEFWDHSIWGTDGLGKGIFFHSPLDQLSGRSVQGIFNVGEFWNNQIDYVSVGGSPHCLLELWVDHFEGTPFAQRGPADQLDVDLGGFEDDQASSWRITFDQPACSTEGVRPYPGFIKEGLTVTDLECTRCPDGEFKPAGAKWTKQCKQHIDCTAYGQYTETRGTPTADAECAPLTACTDDQVDTSPTAAPADSLGAHGRDHDRVCTDMLKYALFSGVWELASTSGQVTHTATSFFSSSETTTEVNAKSFERGLGEALSLGAKVSFGGGVAGGGVSVTAGVELSTQYSTTESRTWTDSVSKTLARSTTTQESVQHTCAQACSEPGVEAYIFKVVGKLPGGHFDEVETCNFACVPLASKDPVPKCPPGKCGNAACSCCDDDSWVAPEHLATGVKVPVCSAVGDAVTADAAAAVAHAVTFKKAGKRGKKSKVGKQAGDADAITLGAHPLPLVQLQLAAARAELRSLRSELAQHRVDLAACHSLTPAAEDTAKAAIQLLTATATASDAAVPTPHQAHQSDAATPPLREQKLLAAAAPGLRLRGRRV